MVYHNDFAVAVKVNGKVLSEQGNTVRLPFGSEYVVLLKNLRNVNALADVTVDNKTIVKNVIVPSNESVELERFVDSMNSGYKLKFIEKTEEIEKYRGNKIEDGILRVEYRFEKSKPVSQVTYHYQPRRYGSDVSFRGGLRDTNVGTYDFLKSNCSASNQNDNGITVEGDDSYQQFIHGSMDDLEYTSYVITLQLKGYTQNKQFIINKPMYVRQKITCIYCGRLSNNRDKFCGECGARLKTF